jgi:F420-dependent oxidoreductase-like protein
MNLMTAAALPRLLFGYHMPSQTFPDAAPEDLFEQIAANALAAEAAGVDLVTVMDHFYQIRGVGQEEEPMLEGYTTLAALAARTSRVRLGLMVGGVTYRNPALVAKVVTSLDVISRGRAVLGMGAAWNETEHAGYGFDFPPIRERMDRLDEALRICHLMFTQERPSFEGRHFRIERALNHPRPIQPGGPPILIGGSGERRTLRMVAQYADLSNWFGPIDELRHKIDVLERHCADVGRDPATILRTVSVPIVVVADRREADAVLERMPPERRAMTVAVPPEEAAERLQPYLDLGFRGIIFRNPGMASPEAIAPLGEVIRLVRPETARAGR